MGDGPALGSDCLQAGARRFPHKSCQKQQKREEGEDRDDTGLDVFHWHAIEPPGNPDMSMPRRCCWCMEVRCSGAHMNSCVLGQSKNEQRAKRPQQVTVRHLNWLRFVACWPE